MEKGRRSEERCTLVGELVQVLEMVRQLDAHMAGQLAGGGVAAGGEERCRALVATMRASIDRSVHIARSSYAEAAGRLPVSAQPESPPSSGGGDGSPRSAWSDQAGDSRGRVHATDQCNKKRKTPPKRKTQVRVSAVQDVTPLDDGLSWRKYGQKDILGAKYPRAYYRCTHRHTQGCQASKQVQRTNGDPLLFDVVYHGDHMCAQSSQAAGHHPSNQTTTGPAASADNTPPQPQPGLEPQTTTSSPMFERTVLPFQLPSNNPASSMPMAAAQGTPEPQPVSSSKYTVGGGVTAGVRDVPEVELASTTSSSPMGDMDFIFPLEDVAADFLENTISYNF